jgi:hypothetical protein
MATINLLVEIEDLVNDDLDGMEDKVYRALCANANSSNPPFPGTVINVTEENREEDEETEEE